MKTKKITASNSEGILNNIRDFLRTVGIQLSSLTIWKRNNYYEGIIQYTFSPSSEEIPMINLRTMRTKIFISTQKEELDPQIKKFWGKIKSGRRFEDCRIDQKYDESSKLHIAKFSYVAEE